MSLGTMEGISSMENIMEHIAYELHKDPTDVRLVNMTDKELPILIEKLKTMADYKNREENINVFNKNNRWIKRGITLNIMLFPVEYYGNYSALVSIYRGDGTVTITSGGIEMGQGLNTKAAQVCAYTLGIPLEKVSVISNYSFVCNNEVFTGSSIASESVCYAIIKACETIKGRLKPLNDELKNASWLELIQEAAKREIDLSAKYMMTDMEPDLKGYSAYAVVALEVEMDVLTGSFQILRQDILEDVGLSANPKIDVGQVILYWIFIYEFIC